VEFQLVKYVLCNVCDGIGGIPCNISPDDSEYYSIGGQGGVKCPKCNGLGRVLRYALGEDFEIALEARENLFYEVVTTEMYERNWGYTELSYYSGCEMTKLFSVLHRREPLNDVIADGLGRAFGTSAIFWKRLYEETVNKPEGDNAK
jgi:hypothetical protein